VLSGQARADPGSNGGAFTWEIGVVRPELARELRVVRRVDVFPEVTPAVHECRDVVCARLSAHAHAHAGER